MFRYFQILCLLLCSFTLQAQNVYEQVRLYLNSTDGVYQPGDTVKVTARVTGDEGQTVVIHAVSYDKVLFRKQTELPVGESLIWTEVASKPVSVIIEVNHVLNPRKMTSVGYLVAPQEFVPGFSSPSDLREYWDGELARMRALKPEVIIYPAVGVNDDDKDKFECYKIEINMPEGNPCRGYVAYPKDAAPGSLPIYLLVHSAGVNKIWNRDLASTVISYARKGCIAIDINAHGFLADQPQQYYDFLNNGELDNYASRPFTGVSDYYFHNMYLRDIRGLDYVTTLPVWDGKRILIHGESQGGGQALALAGIDKRITHCFAIVPAITDTGACLDGRKCGWPDKANRAAAPTPLGPTVMAYHDGAILVSLFKGDLYIECGNIDLVCDPAAVSAGYNNAKAVNSKQIYYFPWRPHTYSGMEARVRDEWTRQVSVHRNDFFKNFYSGK